MYINCIHSFYLDFPLCIWVNWSSKFSDIKNYTSKNLDKLEHMEFQFYQFATNKNATTKKFGNDYILFYKNFLRNNIIVLKLVYWSFLKRGKFSRINE